MNIVNENNIYVYKEPTVEFCIVMSLIHAAPNIFISKKEKLFHDGLQFS